MVSAPRNLLARFKNSLLSVGVCFILISGFAYNYFSNLTISKLHYIDLSKQRSQQVSQNINAALREMYQDLRTVARLPSIRKIDRYAENLNDDAREAIQEIYNNLNTHIRMSEMYVVPADFNPERFDPNIGKMETTIITYDEYIVGNISTDVPTGSGFVHEIQEIEIFEYRAMVEQINWFKQHYGKESLIEGLSYPALGSPELVTCDNSYYSPLSPNDKDRSGLVYSLPFYDQKGQFKGIISGVVLSKVLRDLLPNSNYVLENSYYNYRVEKDDDENSLVNSNNSDAGEAVIYAEAIMLTDHDERGGWQLLIEQPNEEFWDNIDVISLQKLTLIGYVFSVIFSVFLFLVLRYFNRFQDIYNKNPTILFTLSPTGKILSSNEFGAKKLGFKPSELQGENIDVLLKEDNTLNLKQLFEEGASGDTQLTVSEFLSRTQRDLWLKISFRVIARNFREDIGLFVGEDVTDAHKLRQRLEKRANYDGITGLLNRWGFETNCEALFSSCTAGDDTHALLYLDLDDFKVVNDTSGHAAGDELLKQVAAIFESCTRSQDIIGRIGSDEFGIMVLNCSELDAQILAQKLVEAIKDFVFIWQQDRFSIGVSIGLASTSKDFNSLKELFLAADTACYVAKSLGRSRYHLYNDSDIKLEKRHGDMQWRLRIETAIVENDFTLMYQPIIALKGNENTPHFEVLLRYNGQNNELVSPAEFLPAAERYGLVVKLDFWVVDKTLNWLKQNMSGDYLCSINLSGRSVGNESFLLQLLTLIPNSGVNPCNLCFEITETAVMSNVGRAVSFVEQVKQLGCKFSLDDFGSGLSSFAYLKTFPVDYLKIDGQFVRDLHEDDLDLAMVRAIADIGRSFSIQTIAEFVENQQIVEKLQELGVDYAQGYHYAKPRPIKDMFSTNYSA